MNNSNCSFTNNSNSNNQNNNLIKLPIYKYNISKAKLNYKMMNKSINKSHKPLLNNNKKVQNNNYNIKKIEGATQTIVLNINSKQLNETNYSKIKSKSKSNEKDKNISYNILNSRIKMNSNSNYNSSNTTIMYNNILKPKDEIIKKNKHRNQITNICLKKYNNGKYIHYNNIKTSSSFSNNKSSQVDLKYLNNIMKKIHITSYKTANQSRKHSNEKNQIKKNNVVPISSLSNTKQSNIKSKSTSITKVKNIGITRMGNNKGLLNKYSVNLNLTTQTINNNMSHNEKSEKNSKLNRSYYQKNNDEIKSTNNKNKVEKKKNGNSQNLRKYNKYYYEKININLAHNNIHPVNLSHHTSKNESKSKSELTTMNKNIKKASNNNTKNNNNMFNYNIHLKNKGLTGNNNTKIINKINNKFGKNNSLNIHGLSSTLTKIDTKDKKNKKSKNKKTITQSLLYDIAKIKKIDPKNKNKEKDNEKEKEKEENSLSISISSNKDYNYYKNESKKLSEKIHNYGIENNFKKYPETTLEYYKIGRSIGHGAFGKVNISLHVLSGRIVAIKSINKKKGIFSKKNILYEIKLMKKLRGHKNIVTLFETFENKKYTFIIMENIIGGNLLQSVKKMTKLTENQSKNIFKQLIETIKYIHSKNIVHRDIKPHNILLTLNNEIKICDFGVGKEINKGNLINETCGTPAYIAPEVLLGKPFDPYKSDIWSCGVVLYFMLSGIVPFKGDNDYELNNNIILGNFPSIDNISNECNDLIKKILEVNPIKRFSLDDILNHVWVKDFKKNNCNCDLFTKAEKIIYGKLNSDYRICSKENLVEDFTYKNLESEFDDSNQYINSYIITPNNSKIKPNDDEDIYYSDLIIKDNIMKFNLKVKELNLNYEVKYNADVDQGFIRNENRGNKLMRSLNNSIEEEKKENNNSNNFENVIKDNELNKEENQIDTQKNNEKKIKNNNNKKRFHIDENALNFVENFGYDRNFIIESLMNGELNHSTATYYLKISLMNE